MTRASYSAETRSGLARDSALLLIYIAVNAMFVYKYGVRFSGSYPVVLGLFSVMAALMIIIVFGKLSWSATEKQLSTVYGVAVGVLVIYSWLVMIEQDPETFRVGRFLSVNAWLSDLLQGKFPYGPPAHPSGFPGLYALMLPFHLAGDVGLFQVFSLLVFSLLCYAQFSPRSQDVLRPIALLACGPVFWYEVVVRSDLLGNMVLLIACVTLLGRLRRGSSGLAFLLGVSVGILLSTRGIAFLVFAIYSGFLARSHLPHKIFIAICALVTFLFTLLPFVLWDSARFRIYGPFAVQLSYIPSWLVLIAIVLGFLLGRRARRIETVHAHSALLLFSLVGAVFFQQVSDTEWSSAVFGDGFDISYFIFPVPFLLLALRSATPVPQNSSYPITGETHRPGTT